MSAQTTEQSVLDSLDYDHELLCKPAVTHCLVHSPPADLLIGARPAHVHGRYTAWTPICQPCWDALSDGMPPCPACKQPVTRDEVLEIKEVLR